MILRKLRWIVVAKLIYSLVVVNAQNERSYDTNDWIPITPKSGEVADGEPARKATGRVLNLDAPAQKFFPENDYDHRKRRPQVEQFLRETSYKASNRPTRPKHDDDYKFEIPSSQPNGPQKIAFYSHQEVKLSTFEKPPPLPQRNEISQSVPNTQEHAPSVNAPNTYEQYNLPFNSSFYESLVPTSINQDLLGGKNGDSSTIKNADKKEGDKEPVQLVYVPLENLKSNQQQTQHSHSSFRQVNAPRLEKQILTRNTPQRLSDIENDYLQQSLQANRLQQQIHLGQPLLLQTSTTTTTTAPKKRKPHQPSLSVYLASTGGADISDVLDVLKGATSIAVQDRVLPDSPQVFIGPSALNPPGYSKFPLPYLNKLDVNKLEKNINNLPLFVAPLSYKAPTGFSKIPLPYPHVGSIVVSVKEESHKRAAGKPAHIGQNQINSILGTVPDANTQAFIDSQSYYRNPSQQTVTQHPQYLQFTVNDHINSFIVPPGGNQGLVHQQNLNKHAQSSQQGAGPNQYKQNHQQETEHVPARSQFAPETLNQYTKHSQHVEENSKVYISPTRASHRQHFLSTEKVNDNNVPSRNGQKGHHPVSLTESSIQYQPSSTLNLSQDDQTQIPVVSITPKSTPTTTSPLKELDEFNDYIPGSYRTSAVKEKQRNPLDLTINPYELHQINSQLLEDKEVKPFDYKYPYSPKQKNEYDFTSNFEPKAKAEYEFETHDFSSHFDRYTSTPATILRDTHSEDPSTVSTSTSKGRRRGKPSRNHNKTSTEEPAGKEAYTVLEEFSAKSPTTPPYSGREEVADVPANGHRLRTSTPKYENVITPTPENHPNGGNEDQTANVFNIHVNSPVYTSTLQNEPFIVQGFDQQSQLGQNSYNQQFDDPNIAPLVQNRGQKPAAETDAPSADLADYVTNLHDQSVRTLLVPNLLVPTVGHHQATVNIVPTEILTTTTTTTPSTTTTTTTEKPTETTTRARTRGRQRGGSRFSTSSTYTAPAPTRRPVNRRRPVHPSRTTTEKTTSTESNGAVREDFQRVNTRQRVRGRGRPVQNTIAEKVQTTENEVRSYNEPTSRASFEVPNTSKDPQSYIQFDHTIENQKVIIAEDNTPKNNFQQLYGILPQTGNTDSPKILLQYDNTAQTQRPVDIQITHPAVENERPLTFARTTESRPSTLARTTESQVHVQSGGVLHNNRNDGSSRQPARGRARIRARTRTSGSTSTERLTTERPSTRRITTPPPTTTTLKKGSSNDLDEFYGFIRQPNFNQIHNIQIASATQQPLQIYQSPPSVHPNSFETTENDKKQQLRVQSYQALQNPSGVADVRIDFNGEPIDTTTVNFIGQIRPRYRSTTQNYEQFLTTTEQIILQETETPRPRIRARVRAPQRATTVNHRQTSAEASSPRSASRRSNVVRGRGRAQYRPPENVRSQEDKEADVEGGNYPSTFLQKGPAAASTSLDFQISIDPALEEEGEETDQLPNSSIARPKILPRPDDWTEATEDAENLEAYVPANHIKDDEKRTTKKRGQVFVELQTTPIATEQPSAEATEPTTQSSDEAYKEDTKAAEALFQEINEHSKTETTTTEQPRRKKGRRRGAWKLVRQRPVDPLEIAESQNYYSVVNAFGEIIKENKKLKRIDSGKGFSGSHQTFTNYNPALEQNSDSYDYEIQKINGSSTEKPESKTTLPESNYSQSDTENTFEDNQVLDGVSTEQPENKTKPKETEPTIIGTTTESSIFDKLYEMFGLSHKADETTELSTTTISIVTEQETVSPTTTTVAPTFPEEITELSATTLAAEDVTEGDDRSTDIATESEPSESPEAITSTTAKQETTKTFDIEPWQMKAVRTSTSTEVSHETEICYRGRCIKSAEQKIRS